MPDTPLQPSFWDNEENELWNILVSVFTDTMMDGIQGGTDALPADIAILMDFDVVNQAAIDYARQYRYEWISKLIDTTRTQVQTLLGDWIQSGAPLSTLEAQLEPIFGSVRAGMIAQTETNRVFAEANIKVFESTGFISEWDWRTSRQDVCPICLGKEKDNPHSMGEEKPPAHPNCRCWIQPIVDVEAVLRQTEQILNG